MTVKAITTVLYTVLAELFNDLFSSSVLSCRSVTGAFTLTSSLEAKTSRSRDIAQMPSWLKVVHLQLLCWNHDSDTPTLLLRGVRYGQNFLMMGYARVYGSGAAVAVVRPPRTP